MIFWKRFSPIPINIVKCGEERMGIPTLGDMKGLPHQHGPTGACG